MYIRDKSKLGKTVYLGLGVLAAVVVGIYLLDRVSSLHVPAQFTHTLAQNGHEVSGRFGTDFPRIDSQITLGIPEGMAGEVYVYLRQTYVDDASLLKNAFPGFNLYGQGQTDISEFVDDYFDTSYLDFYQSHNTVRFRHRENTVDPNDPKSGRELIQVKITAPGDFETREELKFKTEPVSSRMGNNKGISLLDLVSDGKRSDFIEAIAPLDPFGLRYVLTLKQTRSRIYLDWDKENFLSFSVDQGEASVWFADAALSSVDIGLVETAYTAADEKKRAEMRKIQAFIVNDLQNHFPSLVRNTRDKYEIVLHQIIEQIPYFELWRIMGIL